MLNLDIENNTYVFVISVLIAVQRHRGEEECLHDFGGKAKRNDTSSKT
jgi:hypothetical protein